MKFSLISTVYNEEKSIGELIKSLLKQTIVPDEIIIVDSLSKDNTVKVIKSFKNKRIKVIEKKADIGTGRNIAIKKAKNEIIMTIDGGCVAEKNWCEEMLRPFKEKNADVVGGVFKPLAKNFFEECEGVIVCKPIKDIDESKFLPSSRCLAFKKKAWKSVGEYPKHDMGGEDTLFVLNLKKKGYQVMVNKKAIVSWRMRSPLKNFIKQLFYYAIGDVNLKNIYKMKINLLFVLFVPLYLIASIVLLFLYYPAALIMLGLFLLYFIFNGIKVAVKTKKIAGFYYGFIMSFFKRMAYVAGIWRAWIFPFHKKYKNENY